MIKIKVKLLASIILKELITTLYKIVTKKSLGPNGIFLEFYIIFWRLIRPNYFKMVQHNISKGHFL